MSKDSCANVYSYELNNEFENKLQVKYLRRPNDVYDIQYWRGVHLEKMKPSLSIVFTLSTYLQTMWAYSCNL